MPKGWFKHKDPEYQYQKKKARNEAKNEKKRAKRLAHVYRPNTLQDFELAINQRYGPDDGSKTPPGFQAKNKLFELMHDTKVDENTPKNDQKS